jgi:hypothetical protein
MKKEWQNEKEAIRGANPHVLRRQYFLNATPSANRVCQHHPDVGLGLMYYLRWRGVG